MRNRTFLRILFGIVLLAGLIALGVFVYTAGIAQGVIAGGTMPVPGGEGFPIPYYYPHLYRPWGFGFFGCIFPLLFLLLFFAAMRGLFFHRWRHPGYWFGERSHAHDGHNIPPMVEEWHRKMHSEEGEAGAQSTE